LEYAKLLIQSWLLINNQTEQRSRKQTFKRILPSIIQVYIFCKCNVKKEYFCGGLLLLTDESQKEIL